MFAKTIHPSPSMRKLFFVHIHSYTWRTFSVYTRIKTLSPYIKHDQYTNSIPGQRFLFRFINIHSWFIQKFLYIHLLLTHKNFFSHIIYTHKIFPYTLFLKTLFFSLYIDTTFVHNASFFFLFLAEMILLFIRQVLL